MTIPTQLIIENGVCSTLPRATATSSVGGCSAGAFDSEGSGGPAADVIPTPYPRDREGKPAVRRVSLPLGPGYQPCESEERGVMSNDVWTYRETLLVDTGIDITGYHVEAVDGSIGKIDEATYDTGSSYVVVDTGPWIFG